MNDYIYQRNGMKKHCFSSFFADLEIVRSAMACTRRRIRRREMAECPFLIGQG